MGHATQTGGEHTQQPNQAGNEVAPTRSSKSLGTTAAERARHRAVAGHEASPKRMRGKVAKIQHGGP